MNAGYSSLSLSTCLRKYSIESEMSIFSDRRGRCVQHGTEAAIKMAQF